MLLKRYYDDPLAQASFLLADTDAREAIVVDPNRDVEAYVKAADAEKVKIVAVTETHIHADYLSGTRELARRVGAIAYVSDEGDADWKYAWADEPNVKRVRNGDAIRAGRVRLDVLATPGHTPEHVSFVVTDEAASPEPIGVLTGDFVFAGDVGRPDLLERAANMMGTMETGARTLYASIVRFRDAYPGHLLLWPGHGPGSACGKNLGGLPATSLAYERLTNWGVRAASEDEFVREVLRGQPEPPVYFRHMKRMNKEGPPLHGPFHEPRRLDDAELPAALARGDAIVDLRSTKQMLEGAIPGTLSIPVGSSFPNWAGWLLPYDKPISLLANDGARALAAVRQLAMIGLDDVRGWYGPGAFAAWERARGPLAVTPAIDAKAAFERSRTGELVLLDVRGSAEVDGQAIPGARHIPLGYLPERAGELPRDRPLAVFCGGGTRSRIGISVLRRAGFTQLLDQGGGFPEHVEAGLPVE
ncbi:MAG TPA: MBL fold metallo-hydrolase [Methylomirabilota bacterium]|jgi:hydroxyacylglutathione hydrolase|nr:MBL fold metallo-hydrolase [Methylomirabilota bacterium]